MPYVQRGQGDGLFDRFAYRVTKLWEAGRAVRTVSG
jgi:hypothetical protein